MENLDELKRQAFDEDVERVEVIDFKGDPKEVLKEYLVPKALEAMLENLRSDDERIRQNTIESVLDRGGVPKEVKDNGSGNKVAVLNFDPKVLGNIMKGFSGVLEDKSDEQAVYEQRVDDE